MSKTTRVQNAFLAVLSVLLAALLWLHVQSQIVQPREVPWPVKVKESSSPPDDLAIVSELPTIYVKVSAAEEPRPEDLAKISATVDLSEVEFGTNQCRVTLKAPQPLAVEWTGKNVDVQIDRIATVTKKVALRTSGLPRPGLLYHSATVQPSEVTLRGPESMVKLIERTRAILDLSQQPGTNMVVHVEALDKRDRPVAFVPSRVMIDPPDVSVRGVFVPAPTIKSVVVLTPSWTGQPELGYRIASMELTPKEIKAKASSEVLASLAAVETEPISVAGLNADATIKTRIKVPPGVKLTGSAVVHVRVRVERVPTDVPPGTGP